MLRVHSQSNSLAPKKYIQNVQMDMFSAFPLVVIAISQHSLGSVYTNPMEIAFVCFVECVEFHHPV